MMKPLSMLALASAFVLVPPASAFAESGAKGCKAVVETASADAHAHCGAARAAAKAEELAYTATGFVQRVDKASASVTIAHDAIDELKWPAMTMRFAVRDNKLLDSLERGKKVRFRFVQRDSQYIVTAVN